MRRSLLSAAEQAQQQTPHADGAGITVMLGGGAVYAGSNAYTEAIDEVQYGLAQGPCLSAMSSKRVTRSSTMTTTERRWPRLRSRAADLALGSVISLPIMLDDDVIGSLNLYACTTDTLADTPRAALRRAADALAQELLAARLLALVEEEARELSQTLTNRTDIDLAIGLLMDRYSYTANEAEIMISQLGRQGGASAVAAARQLISSTGTA